MRLLYTLLTNEFGLQLVSEQSKLAMLFTHRNENTGKSASST